MVFIHQGYSLELNSYSNAIYVASIISQTVSNTSSTQCTCYALIDSAMGWNYSPIQKTCELIKNYSSTDLGLQILPGATFFYLQVPPQLATTTTTTTTQTTTAPSCTTVPASNLLASTGTPVAFAAWTRYIFSVTAATTAPTLMFGFNNGGGDHTYLDNVSVVLASPFSPELLNNPGFENSTSTLTGWITWCQSGCNGSGNQGQVTNDNKCLSGNCYTDHCRGSNYDYLSQSFSAIIGYNYTISFYLYQIVGPAGKFYANLYN